MYRQAWHAGLKTTYYLRSLGASNIEKATVSVKKDMRGVVKDSADAHAAGVATQSEPVKKVYTAEEKLACSIEAMRNGEACEACQ